MKKSRMPKAECRTCLPGAAICLQIKPPPDRRVIRRLLSFAHFALDSCRCAMLRQRFAGENRIDAQPAVFRKGEHAIIPPAEKARFGMMDSQRVHEAHAAQLLESGALSVRA